MIDNFSIGVIYGVCLSIIGGLIGYIAYGAIQLMKGGTRSSDE